MLVAQALTQPSHQRILDWLARTNPRRVGARVSDILDELTDSDSFIGLTDIYWDQRGDSLADQLRDQAWQTISPASRAAVLLLGLSYLASTTQPDRLPGGYADLVDRIATAAAAGRKDAVGPPDPAGLAAWVEDGVLAVRHPDEEELLAQQTGECDSCLHPRCDHHLQTGACLRINPTFGPCPCDHTTPTVRSQQEAQLERWRAAAG